MQLAKELLERGQRAKALKNRTCFGIMNPRQMAKLVISYSHADQTLVRSLVALISGAYPDVKEAVFWDADLVPGELWFDQLKQHIDTAPQLFVCWCRHAALSAEVKREYAYALAANKRVVPVLMDRTPLVPELSLIHGIDVRPMIRHRSHRTLAIASTIVAALLVVSFASAWLLRTSDAGLHHTTVGSPIAGSSTPATAPEQGNPFEGASDSDLEAARAKYLRILHARIEPLQRPSGSGTRPTTTRSSAVAIGQLREAEQKLSTASVEELPDALLAARRISDATTGVPSAPAAAAAPAAPGSAPPTPANDETSGSPLFVVLLLVLLVLAFSLALLLSARRKAARGTVLAAFARELGVVDRRS